ncbi:Cupin domain protein [compost metagenome]
MRYPILLATVVAATAITGFAHAQEANPGKSWLSGIHRTDLLHEDLSIPGQEIIQARVDIDPDIASPRHSHPGTEVAYVVEGTFQYQLEGRPPVTLKAGDSLFIPAGVAHVAKNIGTGKASELATYVVKKGEPLLKLEP